MKLFSVLVGVVLLASAQAGEEGDAKTMGGDIILTPEEKTLLGEESDGDDKTMGGDIILTPEEQKRLGKNSDVQGREFEGDILLTHAQKEHVKRGRHPSELSMTKRGVWPHGRWAGGIVNYAINSDIEQHSQAVAAINEAVNIWNSEVSCLHFQRQSSCASLTNCMYFHTGQYGCSSYVGSIGQPQPINLQSQGCWHTQVIVHEIAHALGFWHEQSRPDRDNYVRILTENIIPGMENNFLKHNESNIDTFNTPYDFNSTMHYGTNFFGQIDPATGRPKATLEPIDPEIIIMPAGRPTEWDLKEMKQFYGCPDPEPAAN